VNEKIKEKETAQIQHDASKKSQLSAENGDKKWSLPV
jgi:hypothetical protein